VSLGRRPVDGYRITKLDNDVKFRVTERKRGRIMRGRVCVRVRVRGCACMGGGAHGLDFLHAPLYMINRTQQNLIFRNLYILYSLMLNA